MKLYIQYIDGKIVGHPILLENLQQADPQFDPANLPIILKEFERIPAPIRGPYVRIQSEYLLHADGIVRDHHIEVPYTDEERAARIAQGLQLYHNKGWVFNEEICGWEAPVAPPDDGKVYIWSDDLETWKELVK